MERRKEGVVLASPYTVREEQIILQRDRMTKERILSLCVFRVKQD